MLGVVVVVVKRGGYKRERGGTGRQTDSRQADRQTDRQGQLGMFINRWKLPI